MLGERRRAPADGVIVRRAPVCHDKQCGSEGDGYEHNKGDDLC